MGVVENLSMKGAFVNTAETFPVNDPVTVTIYNYSTPNLLCDLQAKVVRVSETGMGLQFVKTLLD
jgi:PilZ domain-containing protein